MTDINRKELKSQYKQTLADPGVYRIINKATGNFFLDSSMSIKSIINKFEFGKKTESTGAMPKQLIKELNEYGFKNFELEILDRLDVKAEMTEEEIKEDIKLLLKIWSEKLDNKNLP